MHVGVARMGMQAEQSDAAVAECVRFGARAEDVRETIDSLAKRTLMTHVEALPVVVDLLAMAKTKTKTKTRPITYEIVMLSADRGLDPNAALAILRARDAKSVLRNLVSAWRAERAVAATPARKPKRKTSFTRRFAGRRL